MRFRQGVYGNRGTITPMCQVVMLRLSEEMNHNAIVSIPRSRLAEEFGCPLPRVTEWMNQGREAGFLSIVRRGRPGVTAVYQGMYVQPVKVRQGVPSTRYADSDHAEVREGVPSSAATRYALPPTQEVVPTERVDQTHLGPLEQRGSDDERGTDRALNERSA